MKITNTCSSGADRNKLEVLPGRVSITQSGPRESAAPRVRSGLVPLQAVFPGLISLLQEQLWITNLCLQPGALHRLGLDTEEPSLYEE